MATGRHELLEGQRGEAGAHGKKIKKEQWELAEWNAPEGDTSPRTETHNHMHQRAQKIRPGDSTEYSRARADPNT